MIHVFRALDLPSSISGARIMAQKPYFNKNKKLAGKVWFGKTCGKTWPAITRQQIELESQQIELEQIEIETI